MNHAGVSTSQGSSTGDYEIEIEQVSPPATTMASTRIKMTAITRQAFITPSSVMRRTGATIRCGPKAHGQYRGNVYPIH